MEASRLASVKQIAVVAYVLMAAGYLIPLFALVALIIAYIKRGDAEGSWVHYHYTWIINTFWVALAIGIVGTVTLYFLIGWLLLAGGVIWTIYRLVKGGLRLSEERSPYDF